MVDVDELHTQPFECFGYDPVDLLHFAAREPRNFGCIRDNPRDARRNVIHHDLD